MRKLGLLVVACLLAGAAVLADGAPKQHKPRQRRTRGNSKLKRQKAKRHSPATEAAAAAAKAEASANTKTFIRGKGKRLLIPVNVDVLLIGFDGDGGYNYKLNTKSFEELLAAVVHEEGEPNTICPTVWNTGQRSQICYSVTFNILKAPERKGPTAYVRQYERTIRSSLHKVHDVVQDRIGGGTAAVPVYEVEARGNLEAVVEQILQEAYLQSQIPLPAGSNAGAPMSQHRAAVVIVNPNKVRMNPEVDEHVAEDHAAALPNVLDEWRDHAVNMTALEDREGNFNYRYKYNGRGAAAAFVSEYSYVLIDVSAGPVQFGPMTAPLGGMASAALPRIMPVLLRVAHELMDHPPGESQHAHAWEEAGQGQGMLFTGQLASAMAAVTRHVVCPDLAHERVEYARQVLVPIIAIHDNPDYNPLNLAEEASEPEPHHIDLSLVERVLGQMVDASQYAAVEPRSVLLHQHRAIATAIHRAKVSRADPVVMAAPDLGLHKDFTVHLNAETLIRELLTAMPQFTDDAMDSVTEEEEAALAEHDLLSHARHEGTRVLPVFVLSLTQGTDQIMFDNKQLVAATHQAVVVLQTLGKSDGEVPGNTDDGNIFSGHMCDGMHLRIDGVQGVTANIIAGVTMAFAGVVPPFERYDPVRGERVQDWRWALGATPWGPYSNATMVSEMITATARRNSFVSHAEIALRALQKRLDEVDELVLGHLQHPFEHLVAPNRDWEHYHWLDAVAEHAHGFNETLQETVVSRLEADLATIEMTLEQAAMELYSQNFEGADGKLPQLLALVDAFRKRVGTELERARDILACCELRHARLRFNFYLPFEVTIFLLILACFGILAFFALRAEKVMRPGRAYLGVTPGAPGVPRSSSYQPMPKGSLLPR